MEVIKEEGRRREYKGSEAGEGKGKRKNKDWDTAEKKEWVWAAAPPDLQAWVSAAALQSGRVRAHREHPPPWGTGRWTPLQRGSRQDSLDCWFSRSPHKGRSHPECKGRRHCHCPVGAGNKTTGSRTWGPWSSARWAAPPPGSAWCKPSPRTCSGLKTTRRRQRETGCGFSDEMVGFWDLLRNCHPGSVVETKRMSYRWKVWPRVGECCTRREIHGVHCALLNAGYEPFFSISLLLTAVNIHTERSDVASVKCLSFHKLNTTVERNRTLP